jgi:large repetitive protein
MSIVRPLIRGGSQSGGGGVDTPDAPVLTWTTLNTDNTPGFDIDFTSPQVGDLVYMVRDGGSPSTSDAAEITSISPINTLTFLWSGVEAWPDDTYDVYVYFERGAETSPNSNTVSVEINTDVTAPTLSSTSPTDNASGVSVSGDLTATFTENIAFGTGNIVLRENNSGWADVETFDVTTDVGTGAGQVSISGAVLTINPFASMAGGREHAIRIASTAIEDLAGNAFAGIANDTTWSFTTTGADVTAPGLTGATAEGAGTTTGTGAVDTNEGNGTLYFVVTTSATPPSAAQVKAGQNHLGAAATDSGSQSVSVSGTQTITGGFTGLTAATAYYAYFMHEDAAANQSTVVAAAVFETFGVGAWAAIADTSGLTTYTFSSVSFGVADPNRKIVVAISGVRASNAGLTISSLTIGGNAASVVSGTTLQTLADGTSSTRTAIYELAVPTGTSGDIVVTFSAACVRCTGAVARVIDTAGTGGSSGQSIGDFTTALGSITVTIPTGGVGVYYSYNSANASFNAWTNLTTEDFDTTVASTRAHSAGRRTTAGSTAVTADIAAAATHNLVGCAYGP